MPAEVTPTDREQTAATEAWNDSPEIPDADAQEQRRPVVEQPDELDPEVLAGRLGRVRPDQPLEAANEADLAEQEVDVEYDDEEDRQ